MESGTVTAALSGNGLLSMISQDVGQSTGTIAAFSGFTGPIQATGGTLASLRLILQPDYHPERHGLHWPIDYLQRLPYPRR